LHHASSPSEQKGCPNCALAGLELIILLPLLSSWDYRHVSSYPAEMPSVCVCV
jgi:hypothetical protein